MVAADRDSACGGVVQRVGHVRIGEREREWVVMKKMERSEVRREEEVDEGW